MKNLGDKEQDGSLSLGGQMLTLGRRPGTISAGGNASSVLFVRQRRIAAGAQVTAGSSGIVQLQSEGPIRPTRRPEVRLPTNQRIE
jgi:hypothetical protein